MYKLFMAFRYLRSHKIIYFSIAGVALGIMTLVIVTSIMSGFARDMRTRIRGMQSHVVVVTTDKNIWIKDYDALCGEIEKVPHVTGAAPRIEYDAWLARRGGYRDVHLVGILPDRERKVSDLEKYFRQGFKQNFDFKRDNGLPGDRPGVVLGSQMLGGTTLGLLTALAGDFPILCNREFEQVGYFQSGMAEYDSTYIFMHLSDAQEFLKKRETEEQKATVNELAVAVEDYEVHGRSVREAILGVLHARRPCRDEEYHKYGQCGFYVAKTWEQSKEILLQAVEVEKGIQIIIMFLIILVAGFNIIAIYTLVVRSKTRDIGILRALGATEPGVTSIFLMSGGLCGLIGSIFGIALGLLLSQNINAITDFIRVASRGMNAIPRGLLGLTTVAMIVAAASIVWVWLLYYKERRPHPWVRIAVSTVLLAVAAWLSTGWMEGYRVSGKYDPNLEGSARGVIVGVSVALWVLLMAAWRGADRWRRHPSWIFFAFASTLVLIAFVLAAGAGIAIAGSILAGDPDAAWAGLELFPSKIYYLDRIPVLVDYKALSFIVAVTLLVSVTFSIYPALRAAAANPVESMRDE